MKTLQEHNESRLNEFREKPSRVMADVACPKCGNEMHYKDDTTLLSSPPKKTVVCGFCQHVDYKGNYRGLGTRGQFPRFFGGLEG